ncbi:MAG: NADH-quinone oxidoreductase subunit NuoE [bacterium]
MSEGCQCKEGKLPADEIASEEWKKIEAVIEAHRESGQADLLPVLHEVQQICGYLPAPVVRRIAAGLGVSPSNVYGVVSFYTLYYTKSHGKKCLKVCDSITCYERGAKELVAELGKKLGIKPGETTKDGQFTLETVSCLGACDKATVAMVDDRTYYNLTPEDVSRLLEEA